MANLVLTATGVLWTGRKERAVAGGTVTRGMIVSKTTSGTWVAATNVSATLSGTLGIAVCLSDAANGQDIIIGLDEGVLTLGGAVATVGVNYYVGDSAGGIAPVADLGAGEFVTSVGVALTTSTIQVDFNVSGVAL